jgi:hypothetical protein
MEKKKNRRWSWEEERWIVSRSRGWESERQRIAVSGGWRTSKPKPAADRLMKSNRGDVNRPCVDKGLSC